MRTSVQQRELRLLLLLRTMVQEGKNEGQSGFPQNFKASEGCRFTAGHIQGRIQPQIHTEAQEQC